MHHFSFAECALLGFVKKRHTGGTCRRKGLLLVLVLPFYFPQLHIFAHSGRSCPDCKRLPVVEMAVGPRSALPSGAPAPCLLAVVADNTPHLLPSPEHCPRPHRAASACPGGSAILSPAPELSSDWLMKEGTNGLKTTNPVLPSVLPSCSVGLD